MFVLKQNNLFLSTLYMSCLVSAFIPTQHAYAEPEDEPASTESTSEAPPSYGITGNWGGFRDTLHDKGIDFSATEILSVLGNPTGGTNQGAVVEGLFYPILDLDFDKIIGMKGLTGRVTAYQIHGRGLSASNLNNNIGTATGIEAERATRLSELWVQQNFMADNISLRVGEIALDQEFIIGQYASLFINSVFGFPTSPAANIPGGGPQYPLAGPGGRLRIGKNEPWSMQIAVTAGDPTGEADERSQQERNTSGTRFPIDNGIFVMSETTYANAGDDVDLPGTYKLGAWYHSDGAADPRWGTDGLSLSDPSSNSLARTHDGNYGFYGIVDQTLWHSATDKNQTIGGFVRFMWNPGDRNIIAYQADIGLELTGMIPSRKDDVIGAAFSYFPVTDRIIGLDKDTNRFNGTDAPVRDYEGVFELTYQAPINDWLTLQPNFQYILHPGGNIADPNDPNATRGIGDASVFGLFAFVKL
jgi:porin